MLFGVPITGGTIAFFVLALIIIASGVFLMSLQKVMHMALALGGVFLGVAGIFMLLGADFVGVVQIMIYAGAITILMVFALTLTQTGDDTEPSGHGWHKALAFIVSAVIVLAVLLTIRSTPWPGGQAPIQPFGANVVAQIGQAMFHQYAIPFELVSLVLIVALVGASVIARKEEE